MHYDIVICRSEYLSITSFRRMLMAKSRDTRKDAKKKPAKSAKEKKKEKHDNKKEK